MNLLRSLCLNIGTTAFINVWPQMRHVHTAATQTYLYFNRYVDIRKINIILNDFGTGQKTKGNKRKPQNLAGSSKETEEIP